MVPKLPGVEISVSFGLGHRGPVKKTEKSELLVKAFKVVFSFKMNIGTTGNSAQLFLKNVTQRRQN